ncbi:DUF3310 domain-containing protein [Streptomyces tsukubensis]|uniref:DUF3310 domain-containing protein n=1 Tax=Streptomyces tsukubensis TaxID=83656 RepID=UPI00344F719A
MNDDNGRSLTRAQEFMKQAVRDDGTETFTGRDPAREPSLKAARDLTSTRGVKRANDMVHHPSHYTSHPSGVECIQVTEHMNFNLGNALKYIWRAGLKGVGRTVQDLEKARFYIDREIVRISN